jgi:hypothetical protein
MAKTAHIKPKTVPKVGDGVTYGAGADCYPGTIIEVSKSGLEFKFQDDNHHHVKGSFINGDAEFTYSPNPKSEVHTARWSVRRGEGAYRYDGRILGVGHRKFWQDPSF